MDAPELALQAVVSCNMWLLGTELRSSARTVCDLNHEASLQPQKTDFQRSSARFYWGVIYLSAIMVVSAFIFSISSFLVFLVSY